METWVCFMGPDHWSADNFSGGGGGGGWYGFESDQSSIDLSRKIEGPMEKWQTVLVQYLRTC